MSRLHMPLRNFVFKLELDFHFDEGLHHLVVYVVIDLLQLLMLLQGDPTQLMSGILLTLPYYARAGGNRADLAGQLDN